MCAREPNRGAGKTAADRDHGHTMAEIAVTTERSVTVLANRPCDLGQLADADHRRRMDALRHSL